MTFDVRDLFRRCAAEPARRRPVLAIALAALSATIAAQQAQIGIAPVTLSSTPYVFDTAEQHKIRVSVVLSGLNHPFSLSFLPNGDALITERGGRLRLVRGATTPMATLETSPVSGVPLEPTFRTGGLQEVAVHPQFATNRFVYFTYNKAGGPVAGGQPNARQSAITLARGRLEGTALNGVQELFSGAMQNGASGSRLAFGPNNMLFITTGAPFDQQAQDVNSVYGKVLRLRDDGSIPPDNPFVGKAGARGEVFSMGHRDQLGLTVHPGSGRVLSAEHGPNGGDEVNLILPGRNYGWPRVSFGRDYQGPRISESPVAADVEQPLLLWIPSIAPTGMTFYTGDAVVLNDKLEELRRESLLGDLHQRIRDVRQGPDGLLYVITDEDNGALLRIEPAS